MTPGEGAGRAPDRRERAASTDLWRRFRAPLLTAAPSGAVAGALSTLVLQLDGFGSAPDASSVAAMALVLAAIGALIAGLAALGAVAAVVLRRRPLRRPGVTGYGTVALGAGVAVGAGILLVGSAIGGGGVWSIAVLVAALLSALAAAVVTALALRWVNRP